MKLVAPAFSGPLQRVFLSRPLCLLVLLGCLCWTPAFGATLRPVTVDTLLHLAALQDVTVSDDGRSVAFTVVGVAGKPGEEEITSRVAVADAQSGGSKPVSPAKDQCEKPHFSPDGKLLAYVVAGEDSTSIALVCLATGRRRVIFEGPVDIENFLWSPDGKSLAILVTPMDRSEKGRTGEGAADVEVLGGMVGVSTGLFLINADGKGDPVPLVTDRDVGEFVFSPDGSRLAFETISPKTPARGRSHESASGTPKPVDASQSDIAMVDIRTRAVTMLVASPDSETLPRFSSDGRRLAYVATKGPGFYFAASRVMVMPADGGEAHALAETPDARPELLGWSADNAHLLVREASGTGAVLWSLSDDGASLQSFSHTPLMVSQAALSASGQALGLVLEDCATAPEVWLTAAGQFAPRQLSTVNKDLQGYRLPKTELVHWSGADGTRLEGLYIHPTHPGKNPPPLLVEIHGGPAQAADRRCVASLNYYPLAVFAEKGYAIFRPNGRGSDGYGTAFREALRQDWGGSDFDDLMRGVDALVTRGWADPVRMGIMGWSYGGYLTAWAIGHTNRFQAASIGAGITDLVSQAGSMDLPDFLPLYFGGEVYERTEALYARSPIKYAADITTPTLFQHGVEDDRVPFTQSMELFTALSRRGIPTRLAVYPRSGHDVTEPALVRDLMQRNVAWFGHFIPTDARDASH